jgi:hypothetical protein
MRKQWFGDSRDYVKWNVIYEEANANAIVCYLAMARPDEIRGQIDPTVKAFFEKYKDLGLPRDLFDGRFRSLLTNYDVGQSTEYFNEAERIVRVAQSEGAIVIFVDPDTGIEPRKSNATNKHISLSDLRRLVGLLRHDDKLIVYQHAPRNRSDGWSKGIVNRLEDHQWPTQVRISSKDIHPCASDVCFIKIERHMASAAHLLSGAVKPPYTA